MWVVMPPSPPPPPPPAGPSPSPPPSYAPPGPPGSSAAYEFVVTLVVARNGDVTGIQLSGIKLYDDAGEEIEVASVENVGGDHGEPLSDGKPRYPPSHLIDGDPGTKWYMTNFNEGSPASIVLRLKAPAHVARYEFITAPDVQRRDPVSWTFKKLSADGAEETLSVQDDFHPPQERGVGFSTGEPVVDGAAAAGLPAVMPPPPPPSPSHPPAAEGEVSDTYVFVFDAVRGPTLKGIALSGVVLYDVDGAEVEVVDASNPGGSNLDGDNEGALQLIDGDNTTKWYSAESHLKENGIHKEGPAYLVLKLASPTFVAGYKLVTADDNPARDPAGWRFGIASDPAHPTAMESFHELSKVALADGIGGGS